MLEFVGISKRFGSVQALEDVEFSVSRGRVCGVLGENGAGKSTLMHIAAGLLKPDRGTVLIDGKPLQPHSPRGARAAGIGMVYQHFRLSPQLSVLENVVLWMGGGGLARPRPVRRRLLDIAAKLSWQMDVDAPVAALAVGQQQQVEIIKALLAGGKCLVLDEPTAVLTPQESDDLLRTLRRLATDGMAVVFISHKLLEVQEVCDDLCILRRGRVVRQGAASAFSPAEMAECMVGQAVDMPALQAAPAAAGHGPGQPTLSLAHATIKPRRGLRPQLRDVSLEVFPGEIVGVAGVDGNGQGELVAAIVGQRRLDSGLLRVAGRDVRGLPPRKRRALFGYVPEDRQRQGLVLALSVADNLLLTRYADPPFATGPLRFPRRWRTHAARQVTSFDIRTAGVDAAAGTLSGGNQQKVVVARELWRNPPLLVAVNPTRGLDVGATAFVLRKLLEARQAGAAILLVHSDLDELISVSDRVLVLFDGGLTAAPDGTRDKQVIGRMMLGLPAA